MLQCTLPMAEQRRLYCVITWKMLEIYTIVNCSWRSRMMHTTPIHSYNRYTPKHEDVEPHSVAHNSVHLSECVCVCFCIFFFFCLRIFHVWLFRFDCKLYSQTTTSEERKKNNNKTRSTLVTIKDCILSTIDNAKWSSFQADGSLLVAIERWKLFAAKLANQSVCICVCLFVSAILLSACVFMFVFVLNFVEKYSEMDGVTQLMSHVNRI